ncbi:Alb1-domain-containing protein [Alternaria alternata]|nr:Alb1-domain-containing protein [Alternaria alternata]
MAKTAKVKKRPVTIHSRAARRAASPSLNLDKSAQKPANTTRDSASPSRPSQANPHALKAKDAGIQKKQKKDTKMTRAQRLRYQKGLERAEENMDKLEKKRAKSVGKSKKIVERAKGWEDVNGDGTKKSKKQIAIEQLEDEEKRKEREWVSDEDMDVEEETAAVEENGEVKGEGKEMDAEISGKVPAPVEVEKML